MSTDNEQNRLVTTVDDNGIVTLRLNRPERHNAFDEALIGDLVETLGALRENDAVRAVVLTGTGRSFCAGGDLEWMRSIASAGANANQRDAEILADMLAAINDFPRPVIARVNGAAFGGGVGLIAACDIAIAVEHAKFSLSEVRLGLLPAVISPYVVAAIGARQARRWFLTGEVFDAARAKDMELLHEVVPTEQLDDVVAAMLSEILRCAPGAQALGKELIDRVSHNEAGDRERLAEDTAALIARLRASEEGQEGLTAFLEKRNPAWAERDDD